MAAPISGKIKDYGKLPQHNKLRPDVGKGSVGAMGTMPKSSKKVVTDPNSSGRKAK